VTIVLVFTGGGLGAALRWGLSQWIPGYTATIAINVLGSFALALLSHPGLGASPNLRLALGVGVLGGFTTYSTFNLQLLQSLQERDGFGALVQMLGTVGGSLLAGALGWWIAERAFGPGA